MHTLPTVPLGPHQITRLIVGGNPFCGNSHYSQAMNREMADYYTAGQVVDALKQCQAAGINTVQARGDYHRVLHWIELFRRQGGQLHWIAQTASEMHDVFQNIRILASFPDPSPDLKVMARPAVTALRCCGSIAVWDSLPTPAPKSVRPWL